MLKDVHVEYEKDPGLLAEILSALPKKMESTLNLHRSRILGNLPKTRDEFSPASLLSKLDGGEKILLCDSNVDLPKDWKNIDLKKEFAGMGLEASERNSDDLDGGRESGSEGMSSGLSSEEDGIDAVEEDLEGYNDATMNSTNVGVEALNAPKRVLVFTTMVMLGLMSICKYGSVDGTFKAMTKKWKQLFVFMVNYRGSFLPVAFGWLPDKTAVSYHVFLLLLLQKFKQEKKVISHMYGRTALKLRKIKLDFELAIHRAFEGIFKLRGCFFHFSQAGWRKVQKGGMVVPYMKEKEFRDFIRSVIALPFLPINQIESAIDTLRAMEMNKDSEFYDKICT